MTGSEPPPPHTHTHRPCCHSHPSTSRAHFGEDGVGWGRRLCTLCGLEHFIQLPEPQFSTMAKEKCLLEQMGVGLEVLGVF